MLPHSGLRNVVTNQKHVPRNSITVVVLMQAEYGQYYPSLFRILVILFPSFPLEADRHTTHNWPLKSQNTYLILLILPRFLSSSSFQSFSNSLAFQR